MTAVDTRLAEKPRHAEHPIDPLFLERWSPRAFTDETIAEAELLALFEAARWAPSAYNAQPWRFLYARRDTPHWAKFLGLLVPFNQVWASRAAALIVLVSDPVFLPPGADKAVTLRSHSLDAGAAWASLALQATRAGWRAHGMGGFDAERAATELNVPASHTVELAIAIGRPGERSSLPEAYQAREFPSARKPVAEFAFEGGFAAPG
nr:nitroreductase family protein [uncultured Rhodopila sp.]